MKCPTCGFDQVPDDARFCPGCGKALPDVPVLGSSAVTADRRTGKETVMDNNQWCEVICSFSIKSSLVQYECIES